MPSWYNLNKWIRVLVTNTDIELIQKYRTHKKVPKSSLTTEEQQSLDMMVKKGIFGRYKQAEETFYLFNK